MTDINIVIARYAENLDWVNKLRQKSNRLKPIIYNKGDKFICPFKQIRLPNIGKNDHTFLYHIVNNYNNLAPITIFCAGSSYEDKDKWNMLSFITNKVLETSNTVMTGTIYDIPIKQRLYKFEKSNYHTRNPANAQKSGKLPLFKSSIRPFGKWYENMFLEDNENDVHLVCYYSIFSVSADDIRKRPPSFYENLLSQFTHPNEEVGHYIERSWAAIFKPKLTCQYKYKRIHIKGKSSVKTKNILKGKPMANLKVKPTVKSKDILKGKPKDKSKDNLKGKPPVKSKDNLKSKPTFKSKDILKVKPTVKSKDNLKGKPTVKSKDILKGKPKDKSKDNLKGKPTVKQRARPRAKPMARPPVKSKDILKVNLKGKPWAKKRARPPIKSNDNLKVKPMAKPMANSGAKTRARLLVK